MYVCVYIYIYIKIDVASSLDICVLCAMYEHIDTGRGAGGHLSIT